MRPCLSALVSLVPLVALSCGSAASGADAPEPAVVETPAAPPAAAEEEDDVGGVDAPPARAGSRPAELACESGDEAQTTEARSLFRTGLERFQERQYQQAADIFIEAYRISCKVALLFNIARALEMAGDHAGALTTAREGLEVSSDGDRYHEQFQKLVEQLERQ